MGLRDKVIKEENRSFIVSDDEKYDTPQDFVRYHVHGPIKNQYVITEHEFGSLGRTSVLAILTDGLRALECAYLRAKKYAKGDSGLTRFTDRTHFSGLDIK